MVSVVGEEEEEVVTMTLWNGFKFNVSNHNASDYRIGSKNTRYCIVHPFPILLSVS